MYNKYSCINLGVIFAIHNIVRLILRKFIMKQYSPII